MCEERTAIRKVSKAFFFFLSFSFLKVARDSCDVTHSLTQASIHTSHVHASKSCTKYSLHLVQSTSRHTNFIMLYASKVLIVRSWSILSRILQKSGQDSTGVKM